MSKSNYLEGKILDHSYGIATFTAPATLYIALFTGDPGETGTASEVAGNAYARVAVTNSAVTWSRTAGVISNIIPITFAAPSPSAWGTVTHFGLFTAASGSTEYWGGDQLDTPRATAVGVALSFAAGELTHTEE